MPYAVHVHCNSALVHSQYLQDIVTHHLGMRPGLHMHVHEQECVSKSERVSIGACVQAPCAHGYACTLVGLQTSLTMSPTFLDRSWLWTYGVGLSMGSC